MLTTLIVPHGGMLIDFSATPKQNEIFKRASRDWPSWDLTPRQLCDLELLLNGAFSPLCGFMTQSEYDSVGCSMRLPDGTFWPVPIVLDVPEKFARTLRNDEMLALRDPEGVLLAALHVQDVWQADRLTEAQALYGPTDLNHPGVNDILKRHPWYVGGRLHALQLPEHHDFRQFRLTPQDVRRMFQASGWSRVVAFQTTRLINRAAYDHTTDLLKKYDATLLIQPIVGLNRLDDARYYTQIRCYQAILPYYPVNTVKLALLPFAPRFASPQITLLQAIVSRNYGCTHLLTDPPPDGQSAPETTFVSFFHRQDDWKSYAVEIGVECVPPLPNGEVEGQSCAGELMFPEVAAELQRSHPPRSRQGFTVFFTGLSGSGKSTLAQLLLVKLLERGERSVTLLDGDLVRKHLSSELGFSKEHRALNIRRIGFVAGEITKHGGIAICAPIAPYDSVRKDVRTAIEQHGGFILVHVATPLEICEQRDRKGLYARARAGIIKEFTGISDPYEAPQDAEFCIDTTAIAPETAVQSLLCYLDHAGYLNANFEN